MSMTRLIKPCHASPNSKDQFWPAAYKTTQKAAVLTSPAYRRSLSDKLESSDNNKKTTTARRRLSKAKRQPKRVDSLT